MITLALSLHCQLWLLVGGMVGATSLVGMAVERFRSRKSNLTPRHVEARVRADHRLPR